MPRLEAEDGKGRADPVRAPAILRGPGLLAPPHTGGAASIRCPGWAAGFAGEMASHAGLSCLKCQGRVCTRWGSGGVPSSWCVDHVDTGCPPDLETVCRELSAGSSFGDMPAREGLTLLRCITFQMLPHIWRKRRTPCTCFL